MFKALCIGFFTIAGAMANAQNYQVDTFLQHNIKEYRIPALSVAVIDNAKVVLSKSYGTANVEYNIPNTPATAFQPTINKKAHNSSFKK